MSKSKLDLMQLLFLKCVEIADHYCVTYAEVKQDAQTE